MKMDPPNTNVGSVVCEFVGEPLLTGKSFTYSSYVEEVRLANGDKVTSTDWYSGGSHKHTVSGFASIKTSTEKQVWIAVELDRTFFVKMAVFMPRLECCNDRHTAAIVRVGFKSGLDQPVCGRLDSKFPDPKLYTIPCTLMTRGSFVTLELHRAFSGLEVYLTKFGAFGIPV